MNTDAIRCFEGIVCSLRAVTSADIRSRAKCRHVVDARAVLYWVIRRHTTASLPEIAKEFKVHHTAVLYGRRRVERWIADGHANAIWAKAADDLCATCQVANTSPVLPA